MSTGKAPKRLIAQNRKARHDYFIDEELEAGIVLTGTEVKSLREGKVSIQEAYVSESAGELWLQGAHIQEYGAGNRFNHDPLRYRKMLLKKREIARFLGRVKTKGVTIVPLCMYFNEKGVAKVTLGLARGKKDVDKRQSIKERDWKRDKARIMARDGKGH